MKKRVLVADDEPMTAELLAYMLDHKGFEVYSAYDGRDALERIREVRPDAVVLDVLMPLLHGQEVARAVRSDPALKDVPVVLVSSFDESDVAWKDAGADAYLQKPIDICALPDLVQRLIDGYPPMIRRNG
ncbi:MAG: response regulator [Longimicrobiales bacterium]